MIELTFEDPGPAKPIRERRQDWAAIAEVLRSRPGEWAVVDTDAPQAEASHLNRGGNQAFRPASSWEFAARGYNSETKRYAKVYGRYVGEVQS